jgi:hypothetical protein
MSISNKFTLTKVLVVGVVAVFIGIVIAFVGVMAAFTGAMAAFTGWLAWESRANRMEAEKREKRSSFQAVLVSLLWKIQSYDRCYQRASAGAHHKREPGDSFPAYGGAERLPLSPPVLKRVLSILAYIQHLEAELDQKESQYEHPEVDKAISGDEVKAWNDKRILLITIRFYLRQVGCYLVTEARNQRFDDLAKTIEDTGLLEPTADMVILGKMENQFWPLAPEPEDPRYEQCKRQKLIEEKAETRKSERNRVLAEMHLHCATRPE